MSPLTLSGWFVVHAAWQCTLIGGLAALTLGLLRQSRPEARDRVAALGLMLMVAAPLTTALLKLDLLTPATRRPLLVAIDQAVPMPTYLQWRSAALPVIGALWLAGVLAGLARLFIAWRRAVRLRLEDTSAAGVAVETAVSDVSRQLAVATTVEVRRSARAAVPMVLGWRRPLILLPHHAIAALPSDQLRSILAHELAHVRRRDYLANVIQLMTESLTFFHPAARWLSRRIRIEREYCCDDAAIAAAGDRGVYAHALAALDDGRANCPLAVAAVSGTLVDRIERIAGRPRRLLGAGRGAVLFLTATVVAAALAAVTFVIPPDVPAGAKMRSRRPPAGSVLPPPADASQLSKQRSR